jgi:sugar phosphate isomerase/epimerase
MPGTAATRDIHGIRSTREGLTMFFGATVWPFRWKAPYDDVLPRIAALGFRGVELIAWNEEVLREQYTPARIRDLRKVLDGEGLLLTEFVSTPRGMADADPGVRRAAVEYTRRVAEAAHRLGTDLINHVAPAPFGIRFPPIKGLPTSQLWTTEIPRGANWDENWLGYVEVVREIADLLEPAGMRLAIEPHPYRWVANAAGFMRLAEAVESPAVGLNFDPSHMFPSGDMPQVAVCTVGKRLFHTHFSDNDAVTNAHWRPGCGKIDWRAVLAALHEVGYDGSISIELEDVPGVSHGDRPSTAALDREYRLSREYLLAVSDGLGIAWG